MDESCAQNLGELLAAFVAGFVWAMLFMLMLGSDHKDNDKKP